jgi:hypothetical protein
MKENREISKILLKAVDLLREAFGGTDVKIISKEMYRQPPSEFAKAGHLGIDIEIEGIKTFFGHELHATDMLIFKGLNEEFVYKILMTKYKTFQNFKDNHKKK